MTETEFGARKIDIGRRPRELDCTASIWMQTGKKDETWAMYQRSLTVSLADGVLTSTSVLIPSLRVALELDFCLVRDRS